jgi:hypothetical protein
MLLYIYFQVSIALIFASIILFIYYFILAKFCGWADKELIDMILKYSVGTFISGGILFIPALITMVGIG